MSKKILSRVALAIVAVGLAVLWLLSVIVPEIFGFFNSSWAVGIFAGLSGTIFLLKGIFGRNIVVMKKFTILFGAGLLVVGLLSIASAIALPDNQVLSIIAIILTAALLLGILASGGKAWNEADNEKVGYKTYAQRKAEEEKNNRKDDLSK